MKPMNSPEGNEKLVREEGLRFNILRGPKSPTRELVDEPRGVLSSQDKIADLNWKSFDGS